MSEATTPFDWLADRIQARASLSRVEARGMLRVVLRDFGLTAEAVHAAQLRVVVQRALKPALERIRVANAPAICEALARDLDGAPVATTHTEDAADVFGRLSRR